VTHQFAQTVSASFVRVVQGCDGLVGTQYYAPYVEGRYVGYTNYVNEAYSNIKGIEIRLDLRRTNFHRRHAELHLFRRQGERSSQIEDYPGTTTSTLLYP